MEKQETRNIVFSALCMALCMVLPLLTGQIPQINRTLSPMHIPVLLCGVVCGWRYGTVVGLIAPLLSGAFFSMPPLFPTGIAMALELTVYGAVSGLMYARLPKRLWSLYTSLIVAMLLGRVAWGLTQLALTGLSGTPFTFAMFIAGAFTNAVPAIVCHLLLIPLIVVALQKAKIIPPMEVR